MVTTYGTKDNLYKTGLVQNEVTMDDLFNAYRYKTPILVIRMGVFHFHNRKYSSFKGKISQAAVAKSSSLFCLAEILTRLTVFGF